MRSGKRWIAIVLGLAGVFMLVTGITGVNMSFKTGEITIEKEYPVGARVMGVLAILSAIILSGVERTSLRKK